MFQRCVSPTLLRYNGENFAKFETQILIGETSVLWSRFAFCSFGRAFRIAESNQNAVKVGEVTSCWNVVAIVLEFWPMLNENDMVDTDVQEFD